MKSKCQNLSAMMLMLNVRPIPFPSGSKSFAESRQKMKKESDRLLEENDMQKKRIDTHRKDVDDLRKDHDGMNEMLEDLEAEMHRWSLELEEQKKKTNKNWRV